MGYERIKNWRKRSNEDYNDTYLTEFFVKRHDTWAVQFPWVLSFGVCFCFILLVTVMTKLIAWRERQLLRRNDDWAGSRQPREQPREQVSTVGTQVSKNCCTVPCCAELRLRNYEKKANNEKRPTLALIKLYGSFTLFSSCSSFVVHRHARGHARRLVLMFVLMFVLVFVLVLILVVVPVLKIVVTKAANFRKKALAVHKHFPNLL